MQSADVQPSRLLPPRRSSRPVRARRLADASIEALEARRLLAASPIQVAGQAKWTAANGGAFPIPLATVELREGTPNGASTLVATATSSDAGAYTLSFVPGDEPVDLFVRVVATSPYGWVKPDVVGAEPYRFDTAATLGVAAGSSLVVDAAAGAASPAFGVHSALAVYGTYASYLGGKNLAPIDAYYPSVLPGAQFTTEPNRIELAAGEESWDVIGHEYGHYVMQAYSFVNTPGGRHVMGVGNAGTLGKSGGVALAWSEGWATFFALAGQVATGYASLGLPDLGDTKFEKLADIESRPGVGEDDELSVANVLWDLYDATADGDDLFEMSDVALFELASRRLVMHVDQLWSELTVGKTPAETAKLGALFAQAGIAPKPLLPDNDEASDPSNPPTFAWASNGSVAHPLNDFVIQFYTPDMRELVYEKAVGDVNAYTPTVEEWTAILANRGAVKWLVQGRNVDGLVTPQGDGPGGRYWSEARSIRGIDVVLAIDDSASMEEEMEAVKAVLRTYLDGVAASVARGERAPVIQLISFGNVVTYHVTTNDVPTLRAAVDALIADGGGDVPEVSDLALDIGSEAVRPGGVIILATDAPAKGVVDMGKVLQRLVDKKVTVFSLISADGVGLGGGETDLTPPSGGGAPMFSADSFAALSTPSGASALSGPGGFHAEPPRGPIEVESTPLVDRVPGTIKEAVRIGVGDGSRIGWVSVTHNLQDMYVLTVEAGVRYIVRTWAGDRASVKVPGYLVYGADGKPTSFGGQQGGAGWFAFTATESGDYYIRVRSFGFTEDPPSWYGFRVEVDPLADVTEPAALFGAISRATGGTILLDPAVKDGDPTAYSAALAKALAAVKVPPPGPGTDPGTNPGTDPGTNPGTDPGTNPGTDPGTNPGTDPGTTPGSNVEVVGIVQAGRVGPFRNASLVVVSFDGDVDPETVARARNFVIVGPGRDGRFGTRDDRAVRVLRTSYDATSRSLRLVAARRLPPFRQLLLAVRGGADGVRDRAGRPIDGDRDGLPGGDALVAIARRPRFVWRDLRRG